MKALRQIPPVYWIAILLPWIAISQLFTGTVMPDTADGIFHIHRIYAMTRLMQAGSLYPRWIPWFHLGYGYPVFNYYAPLATWLGGVLGVLGIGAPQAFQLISAASWLAGSIGMTALARRMLPDTAALAAAALWIYAPTRMHEYWIQGSLSHVVATALVPWVFLTLIKLIRHPARREMLYFAVAVGLIILAHQPTTYLTSLYAAGIGLALLASRVYRRQGQVLPVLLHTAFGLLIAVGIAAVLLLPLLFEIDAIVINDRPADNTTSLLRSHTVPLSLLFIQPQPLDHTDLSATIPHTYGLLPGVLSLLGLIALLRRRAYTLAALLASGVGLSIFLALPAALDIWRSVPLMDQLRFPWRVLRIGIVPLSLLAAASLRLLPDRWTAYASAGVIALAILAALPTLYPIDRTVDFNGQTAADMIRYEMERGAIGGTSYDEFKPAWGEAVPQNPAADFSVYETDPLRIQVANADGASLERLGPACWTVTADATAWLDFRQFYFPGWQATLNGNPLPLDAESTYGLLRVALPPVEDATLCLHYAGTTLQQAAGWLTVITWGLVLGLWLTSGGQQAETPAESPLRQRWAYRVAGALIVGAVLNGLWIGPHTQWFRRESPLDAPDDMAVSLKTDFTQGYDLLGYTLHNTTTAPGGSLSLTLYWRPLPGTQGPDYYAGVQLVNLTGTQAWASVELPFIGSSPYNHRLDRFISQRVYLTVFEDTPPYVGQVLVQLVDRRSGVGVTKVLPDIIAITSPTPAVEAEDAYLIADSIALVDTNIERENNALTVDLVWQTRQSLALDDVKLFIHALDSSGNIVQQIDGSVFGGDYPAHYWQAAQTLTETYRMRDDPAVVQLAIGMYTTENRLPVTTNGQPLPENRILIDLT